MFCRLNSASLRHLVEKLLSERCRNQDFFFFGSLETFETVSRKISGVPITVQNGDRHPNFRLEEPCRRCRVPVQTAA